MKDGGFLLDSFQLVTEDVWAFGRGLDKEPWGGMGSGDCTD
jgi:hypothetical protein